METTVSDPIESYMRAVIPVGWMRCSCGERVECPRDCAKFIDARRMSDEYLTKMFDDLVQA